jgi:histidyl-tRNA synthetase
MLSTQPAKWTQDRYPQEFQIRKYIFDSWRKVCLKFWYQEYLWPLVENAEIRKAKSGEDVWWSELTMITNREWKISELALRPEMTPTVTRMVAKNYAQLPKPIRYFSIANFYRNERPQRGRNREFRQLNVDMFGSDSIYADVEILTLAISLMLEFNPPKWSWKLNINNRFIIDSILSEIWLSGDIKQETVRLMDKREKLPQEAISEILLEKWLNQNQVNMLVEYMNSSTIQDLIKKFPSIQDSKWIQQTNFIIQSLNNLWYSEYLEFKPSLIRWFDYYDGVVFEIFDTHPDNKRALFGGWRYNWLSKIFIKDDIPAVWFAPGDETTKLFLESRWLIDSILNKTQIEKIYIPVLEDSLQDEIFKLAMNFRNYWKNVITGLETQKMIKAIQYADKQDYKFIVIFGEEEKEKWIYKAKNLKSWKEKEFKLNEDFSVEELN